MNQIILEISFLYKQFVCKVKLTRSRMFDNSNVDMLNLTAICKAAVYTLHSAFSNSLFRHLNRQIFSAGELYKIRLSLSLLPLSNWNNKDMLVLLKSFISTWKRKCFIKWCQLVNLFMNRRCNIIRSQFFFSFSLISYN